MYSLNIKHSKMKAKALILATVAAILTVFSTTSCEKTQVPAVYVCLFEGTADETALQNLSTELQTVLSSYSGKVVEDSEVISAVDPIIAKYTPDKKINGKMYIIRQIEGQNPETIKTYTLTSAQK